MIWLAEPFHTISYQGAVLGGRLRNGDVLEKSFDANGNQIPDKTNRKTKLKLLKKTDARTHNLSLTWQFNPSDLLKAQSLVIRRSTNNWKLLLEVNFSKNSTIIRHNLIVKYLLIAN